MDSIELWNGAAKEYDALIKRGDFFREKLLNASLRDLLGSVRGQKILDAGCGQGYFTDWLIKNGAEAEGLDGSASLIELAKLNYPQEQTHFQVADLKEKLPFTNEIFEGLVANMVLMDFDPIDGALGEFFRILKPGGFFIFSIFHPLTSSGDIKKTWLEKITHAVPHYETKAYKTPAARPWQIHGLTKPTVVYHRPLEFYFNTLKSAGFAIASIKEPTLDKGVKYENNFYELCKELPLFLIVRTIKNSK